MNLNIKACSKHETFGHCVSCEMDALESRVKELERVLELKNITIKALQHNCDVASKSWNELDSMFKLQQERNEKLREALKNIAAPVTDNEVPDLEDADGWFQLSMRRKKMARQALLDDAAGGG